MTNGGDDELHERCEIEGGLRWSWRNRLEKKASSN